MAGTARLEARTEGNLPTSESKETSSGGAIQHWTMTGLERERRASDHHLASGLKHLCCPMPSFCGAMR